MNPYRKSVCKYIFVVFTMVGLLGLLTSSAEAQVLYGSVVGTVTDPGGAVVPGATVTITNNATGQIRDVVSDEAGRYSVTTLSPGEYVLKVTLAGFRPFVKTGIAVVNNTVAREDIQLEVGAVTELISVEATAALLTTDKADVHAEITTKEVTSLPLPAYRNYQSLINLVPGSTPAAFQNAVVDTPARALTTNINGTARNNNNTRVDGAANVFIWLPHHSLYVTPVEAVDTVNITTASFDAEQGMTGGAAVTVTTKSGTNNLHGTLFWYHDDNTLKARPYFFYQPKPTSINNILGGTVGGPIKRNSLFYFFSFERTMERSGQSGNFSVPPADIRAGDFSRYLGLATIYDPLTGNPDGSGRVPFTNNIIPRARISPIFDKIQRLAPLPNQPGRDVWGLSDNYGISGTQALNRNNWDVKINWNATQKLAIWGKYSRMDANVNGIGALGELTGPALGTLGTGDTTVQIPTVGYTYTFSPTFLLDGVFGYTRFDQTVLGPDYGKNWGSEVWGIPGTNGGGLYDSDKRYSGQPSITQGFTAWGNTNTWMPLFRNDRSYLYSANFSKVRNAHEIRFGYDVVRHEMNHWQPETANPRGEINFSGNTTMIKGDVAQSINAYAAGLLGIVGGYSKSVQFFLMKTREWQHAWYIRDRWQATRNLTLNFGLRYEYYPLINRGDRGIERWDPATNLVTIGGLGGIPKSNGIDVSKKLFAPRVGFAYRFGEKTVIRSGYGITYDPLPFSRPLRGLYPSTITANYVPVEQYGFFNSLSQGIPTVPLPDVSRGAFALPPTVDMGPRSPYAGLVHRGYIQSWNLTVERHLPWNLVVSVAYVGNSTVHQLGDRDINAAAPGTGVSGRPLAATQGRLIEALMWDGWMSANYHSLQTTFDRRFSKGLFLKTSYTFGRAINMTDEDGWTGRPAWNYEPIIRRNRAPAGYDRRHMFTMAWIYELPFGRGKRWNMGGVAGAFLGGWKANGVFYAYSGTPFTVSASTASLNAPGNNQTADLISPVRRVDQFGPGTAFYDPASFRDPNFNRPADVYRFGTMGRNALYGPGFAKADVSLFKTFRLTERYTLEFKAEAFNVSNTPRFGNPNANVSNMRLSPDGSIQNANNFMAITSASGERQIRFGLRFVF